MGAFFDSIHVRTEDFNAVEAALETLAKEFDYKFWLGPAIDGWVSISPSEIGGKEPVSANIAALLPDDILHLMVHDDDIFSYYFYRGGKLIDQYNSAPDYFEGKSEEEKAQYRGHPERLQDLLIEKESLDELKTLLAVEKFTFESQRMVGFVELFGIPNALTSYDHLDTGVEDEIDKWEKFVHIEFDPETAEDFNHRGEVKLVREDADGALEDFKKALELNPKLAVARDNCARAEEIKAGRVKNVAEAYVLLGRQTKARGNLGEALTYFDKAIELDPQFAVPYSSRGMARKANGDMEGALTDYNKAIELKADLPETYLSRASIKNAKGDLEGALADCERAIGLKPDSAKAYNQRGELRRRRRDIEDALADFSRAIEISPDSALYYSNRSLAKITKRDLDGALADSNRAIELKPDLATAYNNRGMAKQVKGDLDGALEDYNRAISLSPEQEAFRINLDKAMQLKNR